MDGEEREEQDREDDAERRDPRSLLLDIRSELNKAREKDGELDDGLSLVKAGEGQHQDTHEVDEHVTPGSIRPAREIPDIDAELERRRILREEPVPRGRELITGLRKEFGSLDSDIEVRPEARPKDSRAGLEGILRERTEDRRIEALIRKRSGEEMEEEDYQEGRPGPDTDTRGQEPEGQGEHPVKGGKVRIGGTGEDGGDVVRISLSRGKAAIAREGEETDGGQGYIPIPGGEKRENDARKGKRERSTSSKGEVRSKRSDGAPRKGSSRNDRDTRARNPPREKEHKERGGGRRIGVIFIVAMLVLSSIGMMLFSTAGGDPTFTTSSEDVQAGTAITFTASDTGRDDEAYSWDFGDSISATGPEVTHVYLSAGTYKVTLEVVGALGRTASSEQTITVRDLELQVPEKRIGDSFTSTEEGTVDVSDANGLYTIVGDLPFSASVEVTITRVHISYSGTSTTTIEALEDAMDGLGNDHVTYRTRVEEDLIIDGYFHTGDGDNISLDGSSRIVEIHNSLLDNRTIASDSDVSTSILIQDKTYASEDVLRTFTDLGESSTGFDPAEIYRNGSLSIGANGDFTLDGELFTWNANELTRLESGLGALAISVQPTSSSLISLGLTTLQFRVWVGDSFSFPLMSHVSGGGRTGTRDVSFSHDSVVTGFQSGNTPIPWDDVDVEVRDDSLEYLPLDRVPQGQDPSFRFSPDEAMSQALNEPSGSFRNYLSSNPDALALNGTYTEGVTDATWNMTFGEPGTTGAHAITVDRSRTLDYDTDTTASGAAIEETPIPSGPVLTMSSALEALTRDDAFQEEAFHDLGGLVRPSWENYQFSFKIGALRPSLDLTSLFSTDPHTPFAYILESREDTPGTHWTCAVDGENGQLLYVWTHDGDDLPIDGLGGLV